jgi:hypothetical protein
MAYPEAGAEPNPLSTLEKLAAELDPGQYAAAIIRQGRAPCLRVTNRRAPQLTEDIYAGRGWYWWSWAERISECHDPASTAAMVTRVLRTIAEPPS